LQDLIDYAKSTANKLNENAPVRNGAIGIVAIILLIFLYRKYKEIVNRERLEPVFIRNVKKADATINPPIADELVSAPLNGNSFTYSTWLYVKNWAKNMKSYKHVFHKGDLAKKTCAPAVYLMPNTNALAIIFDTVNRTSSTSNLETVRDKIPADYNVDKNVLSKQVNQTECSCKTIFTVENASPQAVFLNDTKECFLLKNVNELTTSLNKSAVSFTKRNLLVDSMDPSLNKSIVLDEESCVVVENIPLQRWFHVAIVVNETTVEVYIDGKLYKTVILHSFVKTNSQPLHVNLDGGYDGLINELRYYPYPLKYIDVYNMYARGPTPFYFMYLFKGKLELYEEKFNKSKSALIDSTKNFAELIYGDKA
jgi:hypothetical protein